MQNVSGHRKRQTHTYLLLNPSCLCVLLPLILPIGQCALHSGFVCATWHPQSLQGAQHQNTDDTADAEVHWALSVDAVSRSSPGVVTTSRYITGLQASLVIRFLDCSLPILCDAVGDPASCNSVEEV